MLFLVPALYAILDDFGLTEKVGPAAPGGGAEAEEEAAAAAAASGGDAGEEGAPAAVPA